MQGPSQYLSATLSEYISNVKPYNLHLSFVLLKAGDWVPLAVAFKSWEYVCFPINH